MSFFCDDSLSLSLSLSLLVQLPYIVSSCLHCGYNRCTTLDQSPRLQTSLSTTTIYLKCHTNALNILIPSPPAWVICLLLLQYLYHHPHISTRALWLTPWVCLWRFAFFWVPMTTSAIFTVAVKKRNNRNESIDSNLVHVLNRHEQYLMGWFSRGWGKYCEVLSGTRRLIFIFFDHIGGSTFLFVLISPLYYM